MCRSGGLHGIAVDLAMLGRWVSICHGIQHYWTGNNSGISYPTGKGARTLGSNSSYSKVVLCICMHRDRYHQGEMES